jgi:hypothetical protein
MTLSYVKLQEVYASEQNKVGSWIEIGYKDPAGGDGSAAKSTSNFSYIQGSSSGTDNWKATSVVGLNDCQVGTVWMIGSAYASSTGNVTAKADFTAKGTGCTIAGLTPNFCKIGNTTNGSGCN